MHLESSQGDPVPRQVAVLEFSKGNALGAADELLRSSAELLRSRGPSASSLRALWVAAAVSQLRARCQAAASPLLDRTELMTF